MKNALIILLTVCTFALCGVVFVQSRKPATPPPAARVQPQNTNEISEKERRIAELEAGRRRAEEQSREIAAFSDDLAAQAKARELQLSNALASARAAASSSNSTSQKGGLGKLISGMMQDPEMKQFIRDQQLSVMNELYRPLLSRFKLTPEESERFKQILGGNLDSSMELAASMFGGSETANTTELAAAAKTEHEKMQQELKNLLGEERYAQYEDYQQTVGERAQLNQFRQQNSGPDAITDPQAEKLLALMREEKQNISTTSGLNLPGQDPASMQDMFREGQMEKFIEAQQTMNQNVYQRAGEVLAPGQLESFGRFQETQLQNLRMGLTMARKFMTPEGGK